MTHNATDAVYFLLFYICFHLYIGGGKERGRTEVRRKNGWEGGRFHIIYNAKKKLKQWLKLTPHEPLGGRGKHPVMLNHKI